MYVYSACAPQLLTYQCVEQGLDHVIFVAAVDRKLLFRTYAIHLKRSGTRVSGCCLCYDVCVLTLPLKRFMSWG